MLRTTYRINAAATLASGLAGLLGGSFLAPIFAVPAPTLWAMGAFFLLFAAWIFAISRRAQLSAGEALAAGILDGGYALGSFVALVFDWSLMTPELRAAVGLIAAPVALFAAVELTSSMKLRERSPAAAA